MLTTCSAPPRAWFLIVAMAFGFGTMAYAAPYTIYLDNSHTNCGYYVYVQMGQGYCDGCEDCCLNGNCSEECPSKCCWICTEQADPVTYYVGPGQVVLQNLPSGMGVCNYKVYDANMILVTFCDTQTTPGCTCSFDPDPDYLDCNNRPRRIDLNASCVSGTIKWS